MRQAFTRALLWLCAGRRAIYMQFFLTGAIVTFAVLSWPSVWSLFQAFVAGFCLAGAFHIMLMERNSAAMVAAAHEAFADALAEFQREHGPLISAETAARLFFGQDGPPPPTRH